ncbi:unnamed protein product [Rotaria sp. Silwood1]|nr:unnamed protein product [Rotaria sp. Silwood1]
MSSLPDSDGSAKILIIGETGSGKSTFINYLTNYFKNGDLKKLKVAIKTKFRAATEGYSHNETNTADTTKSQTTACTSYKFSRNGVNYTFLDTPGLGDTRGAAQDNQNIEKIIASVESFDGITCVLIVMNGTIPRLTVNVENVIVRLQGFLPDLIMEHVIVVLTNAYRYAANADLEKLLNLQSTVHPFYMQNSAFSTDPSKWDQQAMKSLQADWELSMTELNNLVDLIDTFEKKSVKAFTDMKTLRNDIKSMMHKARLEVENIQKMQDEIAALQAGMKGYDDDITKNKDFTQKKVAVAQLVDAPYHSTICSECNTVCHDQCGLQETYKKGDQTLSGCACMGANNQCKVCKAHCPYTQHYHAKKTMSKVDQTVDEVLHDIKAKYDAATNNKSMAQQKLTSASAQKQMLENALKQKNDEIKKKCLELKKHCSGFNIVAELNIMIKQLETSKQTIKDLDALRQAETFINSLKTFCNQLEKDTALTNTNQMRKMKIQDDHRHSLADQSTVFGEASARHKLRNPQAQEDDDDNETDMNNDQSPRNQRRRRTSAYDQRSDSVASNHSNYQHSQPPKPHPQQPYHNREHANYSGKKIFVFRNIIIVPFHTSL